MYWHYLCRDLGMPLRRVQEEVSSKEFIKHVAFYQLNGRGLDNIESQLAILNQTMFNVNVERKHQIKDTEKFMIRTPLYDLLKNGSKEQQQADKMQNTLMQFTQAHNVNEKLKSHKERR